VRGNYHVIDCKGRRAEASPGRFLPGQRAGPAPAGGVDRASSPHRQYRAGPRQPTNPRNDSATQCRAGRRAAHAGASQRRDPLARGPGRSRESGRPADQRATTALAAERKTGRWRSAHSRLSGVAEEPGNGRADVRDAVAGCSTRQYCEVLPRMAETVGSRSRRSASAPSRPARRNSKQLLGDAGRTPSCW